MNQPTAEDSTTSLQTPADRPGWCALFLLLAFVVVITAKLFDTPPLSSANDRSRWCTVYSLVEENTYQIDKIRKKPGWDTIDLVKHDGHFYSSKPPLLPRLVAELYRFIKWSTGLTLEKHTDAVKNIILLTINILPMAIALWLMFRLIYRFCTGQFARCFLMTAACWGTLQVPFLAVFNNHTIGTVFVVYSLYLAISILVENRTSWWRFGTCGLLAAFAVCNELPAAAYGLALFFLLLRRDWLKTGLAFVPAALVPISGFLLTNYHATGGWKPFYMYYGTEKYRFVHEGKPSYWLEPQGIDQALDSFSTYFLHCTVGHHGIFSLTPVFLVTLLSWLFFPLWRKHSLYALHALGIVLSIIVISFYMTKTENYNYGGVSVALRWTLWLIPFWLLAMLPVLNRWGNRWWLQGPLILLLLPSVFSAWYPTNGPWTQPWIYRVMEQRKLIDYSSPKVTFEQPVYSWLAQLPTGELQEAYWVEFASQDAAGTSQRLRIEDAGPAPDDWRQVRVLRNDVEQIYFIDHTALQAGRPPEEFARREDQSVLNADDLRFFHGVPRRRAYASSRIRYLNHPLRTDALRCHLGYTFVDAPNDVGKTYRYQRDLWFSDEVPFGAFQFEDRVTDLKAKEILQRRMWKLVAAGKFLPRQEPGVLEVARD